MLENDKILQKTLDLVKESSKCSDVTQTVQEADPKVAYGMTEKKRELYYYVVTKAKPLPPEPETSKTTTSTETEYLQNLFGIAPKKKEAKSENFYIKFFEHYFDENRNYAYSSEGIFNFNSKKYSCKRVLKGTVEVYFEQSVIYRSEDPEILSQLFAFLYRREQELKDQLVNELHPRFLEL